MKEMDDGGIQEELQAGRNLEFGNSGSHDMIACEHYQTCCILLWRGVSMEAHSLNRCLYRRGRRG
jgi:hypothetical protein